MRKFDSENPLFICDLANNHFGDVNHAKRIVDELSLVAHETKALLSIKFQFRNLDKYIHKSFKDRRDLKFIDRFISTKLEKEDFHELADYIKAKKLVTMATPFDEDGVDWCRELEIEIIKIASASSNDYPLIDFVANAGKPVVASTAGLRIEEIDNYDKPFYAKILAKFNCKSVFYDAIYHADVHSGNILFVKNQKENNDNEYLIGIIDFGIIGKMSREEQNLFFEFFKSLVTNNYEQISLFIVENLIEPLPNTSCKKLKENEKLAILDGISGIFKKTLDENHKLFGGDEIYNSNKIFRKFGYQFSKFFCRIELAMAISENVCNCLSHDKTYFDTMLEVFKESFPSIDFF